MSKFFNIDEASLVVSPDFNGARKRLQARSLACCQTPCQVGGQIQGGGAVSCTIADGDILAGKISFYSQCQSVKPKRPDIHQKTLGPGLRRDDDIKAASS
jgi:hypothetical protein